MRATDSLQYSLNLRHIAQCCCQLQQILGIGLAKRHPTSQPLDIIDSLEALRQITPLKEMIQKNLDDILPLANSRFINQRTLDPRAQHTAAHGCLGLVHQPIKTAVLLARASIFCQIQTRLGGIVHLQKVLDFIMLSLLQMAELPHLGPVHILQQFPRCLTLHRRQLLAQQLNIVQSCLYIG